MVQPRDNQQILTNPLPRNAPEPDQRRHQREIGVVPEYAIRVETGAPSGELAVAFGSTLTSSVYAHSSIPRT